mgnify:CR=1 FL=1
MMDMDCDLRRTGRAAALAMALLLPACGSTGDAAPPIEAAGVPTLHWTTAYADGIVRVTIEDPTSYYRVDSVTLYGPDGTATPAVEITRENVTATGVGGGFRPSVGVGGGYSSHGGFGTGVGVGLSFPLGGRAEPDRRATRAVIPVAEPSAYRHTAAASEIQATLTAPDGETRYARFPAPVPVEPAP